MTINFHKGDLPPHTTYLSAVSIAIDTETLGLNPHRDRLCVVQMSQGDGNADVIQIVPGQEAPNLRQVFARKDCLKIFHFARFDIAVLENFFALPVEPVWCTKIASRLTRTYTDKHGLKELCKEMLSVDLSKQQQTSDWGAETLTQAQIDYAASDVLYLHALKEKFEALLQRDGRTQMAEACFDFLPTRSRLDLAGWADQDIFAHS